MKTILMPPSVEISNLIKKYGTLAALNDVSFTIAEGETFGLLGPNGAGKTTLIRILSTLIKPTNGAAKVMGFDVVKEQNAVRKAIGVVPQAMTSDMDLTGYENMDIYGRFYDMPKKERQERIDYLLGMVGLKERAKELVATYSGGMRRRLEIARGLIHKPALLILDEPTHNLDAQAVSMLATALSEKLPSIVEQIFVITHEQALVDSQQVTFYRLVRDNAKQEDTIVDKI